ncbi:MAG TPA: SHOCT domain-containing protein [Aldersonia sp.]
MPGLLRGVARTAVVAGTATAVSNRVSRRQGAKWARQEAEQAPPPPQDGYAAPPPQYAPPPPPPPPPPPAGGGPDRLDELKKLGELKAAGVLTEEEFASEKARILAS